CRDSCLALVVLVGAFTRQSAGGVPGGVLAPLAGGLVPSSPSAKVKRRAGSRGFGSPDRSRRPKGVIKILTAVENIFERSDELSLVATSSRLDLDEEGDNCWICYLRIREANTERVQKVRFCLPARGQSTLLYSRRLTA
ncbi:hypothetical protein THAOC_26993, partial [Thalassiosira oceanica]